MLRSAVRTPCGLKIRNTIDPPAAQPRGGGILYRKASTTGRLPSCSLPSLFIGALCGGITVVPFAFADQHNDPVSAAEQAGRKAGIAAPGIIETKDIAEEAIIYGLPIGMNYAVMNEFSVDRNSGQFKAPSLNSSDRLLTEDAIAVMQQAKEHS